MAITSKMPAARGRRQAQKLGIDPARVPPGRHPRQEQRHWF
jgi:hypothetical protein